MDPDATLSLLRELTVDLEAHGFDGTRLDPVDTALQLSALVRALDGWLSSGGFLPRAWSQS